MTQEENLRNGITRKKARVAEIAQSLSQPVIRVDHFGRTWRASTYFRSRLREEQLHLEQAIAELESELQREIKPTAPIVLPADRPNFGGTIERYRKECDWTIATLGDIAGLNEKTVRGHIKGKPMPWGTITLYNDAFTKKLGRDIDIRISYE